MQRVPTCLIPHTLSAEAVGSGCGGVARRASTTPNFGAKWQMANAFDSSVLDGYPQAFACPPARLKDVNRL
ncbi:hypothetical protein RirG_011220 [Rhizophagus irregularis DAOM 197198w]|uniref:Uncharacterized protein n=1 Tax=Rhizophagus irregularis (strain DAOM 197198w) TaxID=1432141 RepID=A0A015LGQ3_RHIIW|nr:hypothetical protein RirG_011220 [Rhizophagus irregularis DAOM 197198w]